MLGKLNGIALGLVAAAVVATTAAATDVPESKRTKAGLYVTAAEAADMLNDPSVVFIDVRSRAEVSFLGLPSRVNVHIPYMVMPMVASYDPDRKGYELEMNPDFPMVFRDYAEERGLAADTPIILICRSGSRSARAADLLNDMGFHNVYSVIDGFEGDKAKDGPGKGKRVMNGWRNAGLDWDYAITPEQSYPGDRW
jgi:rhodanese-related sulfurtransferase